MTQFPVPELSQNPAAVQLRPEALAALRALDPGQGNGFLLRVLAAYLGSLDRYLAELGPARQAGDARAVKLIAHSLKSSSHHVGAVEFAELCATLERGLAGAGLEDAGVDALLARLLVEAPRVRAAVEQASQEAAARP